MSSSIVEYLYLDKVRIQSYHEQFSSSEIYDKVSNWKFILQLTGVSVEGQQNRITRQKTLHEKLTEIRDFYRTNEIKKPNETHCLNLINERLNFQKICFRHIKIPLTIWYSADKSAHGADSLFLIEDYRSSDSESMDFFSGYSRLMLLSDCLIEMQETHSIIQEIKKMRTKKLFGNDSLNTLVALGAEVGQVQKVNVLYRPRATCFAEEDNFASTGLCCTIAAPHVG